MKSYRISILLGSLVALMAALPLGCSGEDGNGGKGGSGGSGGCTADADCGEGLVCTDDGRCVQCRGDGDCGRAQRCDSSTLACVFRDGWGDECTEHADCLLGSFCVQGLCTPAEHTTRCGTLGQCPEGERCNRPLNVCEEDLGCFSHDDCAEDEVCNVGTHRCELRCTPENELDVCQPRERCVDGRCMECTGDDDCGPGLVCNVNAGRCAGAMTCFSNDDCPAGKECNRLTSTCTDPPPPCRTDRDCLEDERCDLERGRCVLRQCLPDLDEPNDDVASAVAISPGTRNDLTVCGTEEDWYRIPLRRGDRINVRIESDLYVAGGMDGQLRDAAGRELARDSFLLDATATADGDHFIRIRTWDAQARYSLGVMVVRGVPCDDDPQEENDELGAARSLAQGVHENLVSCAGDPDWYEIAVPAGRGVSVELDHNPLEGDLDLFLFDTDGRTQLDASQTTEAKERVEAPGVSGGRAYVLIVPTDDRTQNAYDLSIVVQ